MVLQRRFPKINDDPRVIKKAILRTEYHPEHKKAVREGTTVSGHLDSIWGYFIA
jgi:hypothetical protein